MAIASKHQREQGKAQRKAGPPCLPSALANAPARGKRGARPASRARGQDCGEAAAEGEHQALAIGHKIQRQSGDGHLVVKPLQGGGDQAQKPPGQQPAKEKPEERAQPRKGQCFQEHVALKHRRSNPQGAKASRGKLSRGAERCKQVPHKANRALRAGPGSPMAARFSWKALASPPRASADSR